MSTRFDDDDPAVIQAKAEAQAKILEARAKLHPIAQLFYTILGGIDNIIGGLGCLLILAIIAIAIFAPSLISALIHLITK